MRQLLNDLIDFLFNLSVAVCVASIAFLVAEPFIPKRLPQIKIKSKTMMLFDGVPDNKSLDRWAR